MMHFTNAVHFCCHRCFFGKRGSDPNTADPDQPLDGIYVNSSTHNTPKHHNTSVESESKDNSGEINHYKAPDMNV